MHNARRRRMIADDWKIAVRLSSAEAIRNSNRWARSKSGNRVALSGRININAGKKKKKKEKTKKGRRYKRMGS